METYFRKWEKENLNELALIGEAVRELGERLWRLLRKTLKLFLFLSYLALRVLLHLSLALMQAPKLVREIGPGLEPLAREEFEKRDLALMWGRRNR